MPFSMYQVDNINPSTAKRVRTDGGPGEDDWICRCGKVNSSFRTTCSLQYCSQPRPFDHNVFQKSAMKSMQPPPYSYSAPFGGPPSSSMYMGMPPYGTSAHNVSSMPPFDVPFSAESAYHHNFGGPLSGGIQYRPLPLSGPPPYSGGSVIGNAVMYGMPRMSMPPMLPPFMAAKSEENSKHQMPEGSWKCGNCGNMNYPFWTKCYRQSCWAGKASKETKSPSPTADGKNQGCKKKGVLFASQRVDADGSYEIHVETPSQGPEHLLAERDRMRLEVLNSMRNLRDCHRNSEGQLCYSESPFAAQLYHHLDAMYTEDKEAVLAAKQELDFECADAALKDYNGKHGTQYELVEVLGRSEIHHLGMWFHLNFLACEGRSTEVFFAELHLAGAFHVKSCCILNSFEIPISLVSDCELVDLEITKSALSDYQLLSFGTDVVGGCGICESYIKHPVGGFEFPPDYEKMLAAAAAPPEPPFLGSVRSLMASRSHTFPQAY